MAMTHNIAASSFFVLQATIAAMRRSSGWLEQLRFPAYSPKQPKTAEVDAQGSFLFVCSHFKDTPRVVPGFPFVLNLSLEIAPP